MKRILCDLDGTLTIDDKNLTYEEKEPRFDVIDKLVEYKNNDYEIVIFTARNMQTFAGDINKIKKNTLPIIKKWLKKYNVPYDQIIVGKPWCGNDGFYLDDKSIRPEEFLSLNKDELKDRLSNKKNNDNTVFLITSADYIDDEMQREFGKIPPIFLPLNNKILFLEQAKSVPKNAKYKFVSLPNSFNILPWQKKILDENGFQVVYCDEKLSLAESIIDAINQFCVNVDKLQILLGDTIFHDINFHDLKDAVSIHKPHTQYKWSSLSKQENVVSGFFSFIHPYIFLKFLTKNKHDFIKAVDEYIQNSSSVEIISNGRWFDFGHLQTYFSSRRSFTTERIFNNLSFDKHSVTKSSLDKIKMEAEVNWYKKIPANLTIYTPRLLKGIHEIEKGKCGYKIESLDAISLSDLYTTCNLSLTEWEKIFKSSTNFLKSIHKKTSNKILERRKLYIDKTNKRIKEFSNKTNISLSDDWIINDEVSPSLQEITDNTWKIISDHRDPLACFIHGDFCFSNILFDSRSELIRVIDPRGKLEDDQITPFGDPLYDIAKFNHSLIGFYDFIIGERYDLYFAENKIDFKIHSSSEIEDILQLGKLELISKFNYSSELLAATTIQLFLSMLPLHYDNFKKQLAIIANTQRLYKSLRT